MATGSLTAVFDTAAFADALKRTSVEIQQEVATLAVSTGARMADRLQARYPLGRKDHSDIPHMRNDIRVRKLPAVGGFIPGSRVQGPRLAFIWQDGTRRRYDATRKNAYRGISPPQDPGFFERTAVQVRTDMLEQAQQILDRPREIR